MLEENSMSCFSVYAQLKEDYPTNYNLCLCFDKIVIKTLTNSDAVRQLLAEYFHTFITEIQTCSLQVVVLEAFPPEIKGTFTIKQPEPGKDKIKEEFIDLSDGRIVRKRQTGMVFVLGQTFNLAIGPCLENLNQVINFINNRFIEQKILKGAVLAHAAGISHNGCGLAIAGFSGMGKSTLALHLLNYKANFISNDRLLIEPGQKKIMMSGVAKLPRINPGTALTTPSLSSLLTSTERKKFAKLTYQELWKLEYKYDVPIEKLFGQDRLKLVSPLDKLVILNWHHNDEVCYLQKVSISERLDLLQAFIKDPGIFFLNQSKQEIDMSIERYIELLSGCEVFELRGGVDFQEACKRCLEIMTLKN